MKVCSIVCSAENRKSKNGSLASAIIIAKANQEIAPTTRPILLDLSKKINPKNIIPNKDAPIIIFVEVINIRIRVIISIAAIK